MGVPSEGWDTETTAEELPATRARAFDNWVPQGVSVAIRKGYTVHATGLGAAVETLLPYNAGASSALFAAVSTSIYNVTSAGAVGAAVVTSLTNARFSSTNFTTSGGAFLWICNGADDPRTWNGTAWAVPSLTITTYTDNDINFVFGFKERLYFFFKNTLTFGYLPTQQIAGTVANFPLGAVFSYGGRLVAGGSLSRDGGSGMDDYAVFLTSEGEIAVYQGSNPGDAAAWELIGVYYLGEPVGDRPMVELGGDLGIITRNGLISIGKVMAGEIGAKRDVLSRIATPFQQAITAGQSFNGWEGLLVPNEQLVLVNGPTDSDSFYQYTRNTINGACGRFTGWDFNTFDIFNGDCYAGAANGKVVKCFASNSDNSADITAALKTGWSTLGYGGVKAFQEIRPVVTTDTSAVLRLVGQADFGEDDAPLPAWPSITLTNALIWGTGLWGTNVWGGLDQSAHVWRAISGQGHTLSLSLEARSNQSPYALNGFNLRIARGGQV